MEIRAATEADFDGMCRLWAAVDGLHARLLPHYFRLAPEPPRARSQLRRQLAADDLLTLVAEEQGAVIGLAEARLVDTPAQPQLAPCRRLYLEDLVVEATWRRRGVGRALVEAATEWGRQRGARAIVLTVWAGNEGAESFYASLGFGLLNRVLTQEI